MLASCNDPTMNIYTDGSYKAASGIGGWAFVVLAGDRQVHAASGKASGASNNSFEVLALLYAMSWVSAVVPVQAVTLWSDSVYVIEGCRRWRDIWRTNGWKRISANPHRRRRPIRDLEFLQQLDVLLEQHPQVTVEWCKGHTGAVGNKLADAMARDAARL